MTVTRRRFLESLAATRLLGTAGWSSANLLAQAREAGVPVRAITKGPDFHWFGYYDKLQFDPTSRYVLGQRVSFQGRTPAPDDVIHVGMIDTEDGDRWIDLGETRAWSWQQGCMLQWIPGSAHEVIWNDRDGQHFISHILDVQTRKARSLPAPVYALSPDGKTALHPDFGRLHDTRPGYGYAGIVDPNRDAHVSDKTGIWKLDLQTGKERMLFSLADVDALNDGISKRDNVKEWLNHLLFAQDGLRFCFLHRWVGPKGGGSFDTRLITANPDGTDLYALDPYGKTSHFIWKDPRHILAWSWHPSAGDKFYIYEDHTRKVEVIGAGVMTENGHCTYLPGNKWILNDTYPDPDRYQHPYLYQVATGRKISLGDFRSPPEFKDEFRCDTHPRFSPDGRKVTIDSPHGGDGRQIYLIDISSVVGKP